ncbi:unnamed protein product [Aphanomyces euteiches]
MLRFFFSFSTFFKHGRTFTDQGVHLSYLPLAHCFEHKVQSIFIKSGGSIGFYQGNPLKLTEDLAELRPTIFTSVPRLLNKIYDKVITAGRSAGGIKSWLFDLAMSTKLANLKQGYTKHVLFDKLIFSKVQKKLGLDRCCMLVSGAAPLAEDVMDFYRILFDFPIVEGYGQSETVAAATIMHLDDAHAEMGYNVTDTVHGDDESTRIPVLGRGEICILGPVVFPGYYKEPTKTAEVFDDDGWLLSGDIGVWTLDGRLKIVDHKNIFKLSQGEYIALEKIENVLVTSPYVAQPFVYGDSLHAVLVAIIVPEEEHLMNLAKKLSVSGTFEDVCRDTRVMDAVLKDLVAVSKKNNLFGYETVNAIKLHPEPFTIASNLMTPTFKLKRQDAKAVFRHDISALYEKCGDLVAVQCALPMSVLSVTLYCLFISKVIVFDKADGVKRDESIHEALEEETKEEVEEETPQEEEPDPNEDVDMENEEPVERSDKEPTKLVKPQSAYFHFLAANRAKFSEENPGVGIGPLQKLLSTRWNELTPEEKEPFVELAAADKERYRKEEQALIEQGIDISALSNKKTSTTDENTLTLPLARVKRIVMTDPDVQKLSKDASLAIAKATEQFIQFLAAKSYDSASISKRKTIKDSDVLQAIHSHAMLDWLRDDFPEKSSTKLQPQQQQSASKSATETAPSLPSNARITSYFTRE